MQAIENTPKISLCMIVKNEADQLPRCLTSVAGLCDEIILVDTGSTDETVSIAKDFGAKIFTFEWRNDFAAARNFSLKQAAGEWILVLDADEELAPGSRATIREVVREPGMEGYFWRLICLDHPDEKTLGSIYPAFRMFRNRPQYRYTGRVHEYILSLILQNNPSAAIGFLPVTLYHYGYLPEIRKAKHKAGRNLILLQQTLQEEGLSTPLCYYMANEYLINGDFQAALEYYRQAISLDPDGQYLQLSPSIYRSLLNCLIIMGQWDEIPAAAAQGLKRYPDYTDLYFQSGFAWLQLGQTAKAFQNQTTCLKLGEISNPNLTTTTGVGSFLAWREIGKIYAFLSHYRTALKIFQENIRINPHISNGWLDLKNLFALGLDFKEEWPDFQQFLNSLPLDLTGKMLFAEIFSSLNWWTPIYEVIGSISSDDLKPKQIPLYNYLLGCSLFFQNRHEEAMTYFDRITAAPGAEAQNWLILLRKIEKAWTDADYPTAALLIGALEGTILPEPAILNVYQTLHYQFAVRNELPAEFLLDAALFQILCDITVNLALLQADRQLEQIVETAYHHKEGWPLCKKYYRSSLLTLKLKTWRYFAYRPNWSCVGVLQTGLWIYCAGL